MAYQFFVNQKYKAAYTKLLLSFKETAIEGFPLNLENSKILMGLCQMYLGQFDEAIQVLDKSTQFPNTQKFRFYYFLALIYNGEIANHSFEEFLETNQIVDSSIGQNRIQYLHIALLLVNKEFDKATKMLEQYDSLSHKHQLNINALKSIVNSTTSKEKSDKIKPLYKAILGYTLEKDERQYLSLFPELDKNLSIRDQHQNDKSLKTFLNTLCNNAQTLGKDQLAQAMDLADESLRPYIIYNQLSLLYNRDREQYVYQIYQSILKYDRAFSSK